MFEKKVKEFNPLGESMKCSFSKMSTQVAIFHPVKRNSWSLKNCKQNVALHRITRKALQSLNGARVISTFSVRIETAAIVFKQHFIEYCSVSNVLTKLTVCFQSFELLQNIYRVIRIISRSHGHHAKPVKFKPCGVPPALQSFLPSNITPFLMFTPHASVIL